ncbi:Vacuolar cation-chloride cotransporter [Lachnellula subtilissima]|uniref:Vacuolar cation-chloride cotransporter n=1 Tax=Lachnellula subtilissima TaxID=602034 RepID=A0A8H8U7E8_9HELO|nr:Vacuolar cation-chloride cotransporter [Lachnellula subtilissima]
MSSSARPQLQSSSHSNFRSRTATDNAGELNRRYSNITEEQDSPSRECENPYEPATNASTPPPREHAFTKRLLRLHSHSDDGSNGSQNTKRRSASGRRKSVSETMEPGSLTAQLNEMESKRANGDPAAPRPGLGPRPIGGSEKLGLFSGVYVPTCLNVLSILMFLRFGFLLGQAGVYGIMGMLVAAYAINLITTFSLSAIASNGTVRGGGAYYLISRSLGPEFGGSIGVVFYLGFAFNTGMNAVGLIDCIKLNFGSDSGNWSNILPESTWYLYLWSTIVLVLCTAICLAGSSIFARASNGLLVILLLATLSIPFSALIVSPFESRKLGIDYTGLSLTTFLGNLKPQLTKGAAGSQLHGKEDFQDLFGILFPATGGIFAGASMSGDLKNPSKSIPKGTLYGLGTTFVLYTLVILAMAATTTRSSFVRNANVIQDTNISGVVILAGEFASSFFSTLMGVIGSAKLLQALARDNLLPGFSVFGQGTKNGDEPTYAIIATFVVAQLTMLFDLNKIASFVTMTYLMTFLVMNLACFLLSIGSAPNFRPSFHFFNWQTALAGTLVSGTAMFFVDGLYATGCVGILIFIFLIIHYASPPKSWGDVSQSLIYHQVRKYLLRLKQEHVKFWRPQILLLVNDPRRQYKLIQFCNSLKKGGLYVLGHVIVTDNFAGSVPEARRQQAAWTKYIDFSKIKAFVNIAISPGLEWGARNIVLSTGLGGMRPNIAVMGFYNLDDLRRNQPLIDVPEMLWSPTGRSPSFDSQQVRKRPRRDSTDAKMAGDLPTDSCKTEGMLSLTSYVTVLEDLLLRLQINVAVAKGFQDLEFPHTKKDSDESTKKYIDLWPIQMSAEIASEGDDKHNVLTTNFDTYTLILQLGVILNTVPAWKKAYKVRVAVFVEYESDVEEERGRVQSLLENLRIEAEVLVFWLASGNLPTYEIIVNGVSAGEEHETEVEECLKGQEWWDEIQKFRGNRARSSAREDLSDMASIFTTGSIWPESSFQQGPRGERVERFLGLRKLLRKSKRKPTMSGISKLGVRVGMRTHNLSPDVVRQHASQGSASEDSEGESDGVSTDSEVIVDDDTDNLSEGIESAASEGDIDDFESEDDAPPNITRLVRRRSHGDSIRGPPPSKKSTGEKEVKVPERPDRRLLPTQPSTTLGLSETSPGRQPTASGPNLPPQPETPSSKPLTVSNLTSSIKASSDASDSRPTSALELSKPAIAKAEASTSNQPQRPSSVLSDRPSLSRHASTPKFSSKPVPITRVATEDGPGPSIMFTDTPSPPPHKRQRLPSAYRSTTSTTLPDHISEVSTSSSPENENEIDPQNGGSSSRRGSTYSTAALPLSFNDLPCRAQHLILNELMRSQSGETAVMFTTLPSPAEGTSQSAEACAVYLGDLEVLCKGCPPVLLVHSNSMTVTMSL